MSSASTASYALQSLIRVLHGPQRVVGTIESVVANIEMIASALVDLQRDAHDRLASLDQTVSELRGLEQIITRQTEAIRVELNNRMVAVEADVDKLGPRIERIARDLATIVQLLPNPSDGPLARLRDTLTASRPT